MADEMTLENYDWESDEGEDWESDEAIAEADESDEAIGERARRSRRRRRRRFRPGRGVSGITVRDTDGRTRNMPFPAKLATAEETNRGLANQEVARRSLEERLDKLENRFRGQQKNDSSVSGVVTLLIGGGLSAWGFYEASKISRGTVLEKWAKENSTKIATVTSAAQIVTSGAKLAINGRYHRSGFAIAADAFAAAQLAAFAFGSLHKERPAKPGGVNLAALRGNLANLIVGDRYITDDGNEYDVVGDDNNKLVRLVK